MEKYFDGIFGQGLFAGFYLFLLTFVIIDADLSVLSSSPSFVATILAAFLGGLFLLISACFSIYENRKDMKNAITLNERNQALQLFTKITDINDTIGNLYSHINSGIERYQIECLSNLTDSLSISAYVTTPAYQDAKTEVTASERSILLAWGEYELYNQITMIEKCNDRYIDSFNTYCQRRNEIFKDLDPDSVDENLAAYKEMKAEDLNKFKMEVAPLNDLLDNLWKLMGDEKSKSREIHSALAKAITKKTDLTLRVEYSDV